ncbi:MAG: NAD(P)-dependent oxidoreductase, partial [Pseudomonadota bacterium]
MRTCLLAFVPGWVNIRANVQNAGDAVKVLDFQNPRKDPSAATPRRMEDLSVLPIFQKLEGRRVVLVGGGAAAAWKAELIAAAGAHVEIYATELEDEMQELLARGAGSRGQFVNHQRPWATDIFGHAALAVAELESDGEAHAFFCAARAAGVPVNVIDNPKFCEFQFGGIVNRSPAVIAISTDGAAPILGQAIRRRIETLVPPFIADWAAIARSIRGRVGAALEMGQPRRAFWEKFADRAFSAAPSDSAEVDAL